MSPLDLPLGDLVEGDAQDDTFPQELADALVGVQRLLRRRLRAGLTVPRLRGAEVELLRLAETRPGIGVSEAMKELYAVDALRGLLLGAPAHLAPDFGVLIVAAVLGITAASAVLGRPAR